MERLFGAFSTAPDFLLYLGAWICMPLDENLDEMVRRKLIAEAVDLFRWRGTRRGLSRYLEILTGSKPDIDDQPVEGMRLGSHAKLGTDQTVLGDIAPSTFVVTLAVADPAKVNERALIRVIESFKPAHTTFKFRTVSR
jgi:phage tail-like protein